MSFQTIVQSFTGISDSWVIAYVILPVFILLLTVIKANIVKALFTYLYNHPVAKSKRFFIDQTHLVLASKVCVFLVYIIGVSIIIYNIPFLRSFLYSILAGAGILALIVGFAMKDVFSNLVSGVFLAFFKPFKVGDKITVKGQTGVVEDITIRHIIIHGEGKKIIVPNSIVSNEIVVNYVTVKKPIK